MSIQNPGRNRLKVTSSSSALSHNLLRTSSQPWVAAANIRLATIALDTVRRRSHHESTPIISNWVLKMNMKGRIAVRIEYAKACTPATIGSQRAMPAAA